MGELGRRKFLLHVTALGLGGALSPRAAWVQGAGVTPSGDRLETVRAGQLPSFAAKASPKVQEAYRYAAANGEVLKYFPCFCGCVNIGHRHNGDCYVTERHREARITFNSHGAGRDICLNITRDVVAMKTEGKALREIRAYIDKKYGHFGPGTPTPQPPA